MTINHLNLVVNNLHDTVSFFETYFGFKCIAEKGGVISILKNQENFTLVLMTGKEGPVNYPKNFHIGFMLESLQMVDDLYLKLKANMELTQSPAKIRDSYGFYFYFDTVFIEVGHYLEES